MNLKLRTLITLFTTTVVLVLLSGCNPTEKIAKPTDATQLTLSQANPKIFHFEWQPVAGASHYVLLENPDGQSGFTELDLKIPGTATRFDLVVPLFDRFGAQYSLQGCNKAGCGPVSNTAAVADISTQTIGYLKAATPLENGQFGYGLALSRDGKTLAVGAKKEVLNEDNTTSLFDEVYVLTRNAKGQWSTPVLVHTHTGPRLFFNDEVLVDLDDDGDTLAISTNFSDIGDNIAYIYEKNDNSWQQTATMDSTFDNDEPSDLFTFSIALSGDGSTLALGEPENGQVSVFQQTQGEWGTATPKVLAVQGDINFGYSIALNRTGTILAILSTRYQHNVYIYQQDANGDYQPSGDPIAYSPPDNTGKYLNAYVDLDAEATTLVIGTPFDDVDYQGVKNGIDAPPTDPSAPDSGAALVYTRQNGDWQRQAFIKASNAEADDKFGTSVSLSTDGNTLTVGAPYESSDASGLIKGTDLGDADNNELDSTGAVYVFHRDVNGDWHQQAYLKSSNPDKDDHFGYVVSLSGDGQTLVISAPYEDSNNPDEDPQADNSLEEAGAVYLY
ncbi:FG-GAP repeat protein [bacterium]|nr:FG-GAP repeat protein [bacterium]